MSSSGKLDDFFHGTPGELATNPGKSSPTIGALAKALSQAQKEFEPATKDKNNPFYRSRYASISAFLGACRVALSSNNLAVVQRPQATDGTVVSLETVIMHESGEWMSGLIVLRPAAKYDPKGKEIPVDPQRYGSALKYARRQSLEAMLGLSTEEDDDANAASNPPIPVLPVGAAGWIPKEETRRMEIRAAIGLLANDAQIRQVKQLCRALGWKPERLRAALKGRGVSTVAALGHDDCRRLITRLQELLAEADAKKVFR